jgi:hypothetical protein
MHIHTDSEKCNMAAIQIFQENNFIAAPIITFSNFGKIYQTGGICFNNDKYHLAATISYFSSSNA